eukprot:g32168.t2
MSERSMSPKCLVLDVDGWHADRTGWEAELALNVLRRLDRLGPAADPRLRQKHELQALWQDYAKTFPEAPAGDENPLLDLLQEPERLPAGQLRQLLLGDRRPSVSFLSETLKELIHRNMEIFTLPMTPTGQYLASTATLLLRGLNLEILASWPHGLQLGGALARHGFDTQHLDFAKAVHSGLEASTFEAPDVSAFAPEPGASWPRFEFHPACCRRYHVLSELLSQSEASLADSSARLLEIGAARRGEFDSHDVHLLPQEYLLRKFDRLEFDGVDPFYDAESIFAEASQRIGNYGPRARLWRMSSQEAAARFPPETFDVVFIDGDHSYSAVREDLRLWRPKIRPGGLLAGHDLFNLAFEGVLEALVEHLVQRGVQRETIHFSTDFVWFWPQDAIITLGWPATVEQLLAYSQQIQESAQWVSGNGNVPRDAACWAVSAVITRSFAVDDEVRAMIPLADIFNHEPRSASSDVHEVAWSLEGDRFEVHAPQTVMPGEDGRSTGIKSEKAHVAEFADHAIGCKQPICSKATWIRAHELATLGMPDGGPWPSSRAWSELVPSSLDGWGTGGWVAGRKRRGRPWPTKLEITEAFRLVRPGGVLLGDDLDWPAVEADLSSFLTEHGVGASQSADDDLFHGLCGTFFFAAGGFWVVDAQPRQWLLRKPPWAPGRDALKAEVRAAEMGDTPTEFVPATMEDQEALALYQQGIAKLETGDTAEGSRLLKIAGKIQADYLEVFESVEDLVAAVESICGAPRRDRLARLEVIPVDDLLVRPGRLEASEPLLRALQAMLCEDDELCDPGERRLRLVCSEERQQSLRLEALLLLAQILRGALRCSTSLAHGVLRSGVAAPKDTDCEDMPDAGSPDLAVRYRRHVAEMLNHLNALNQKAFLPPFTEGLRPGHLTDRSFDRPRGGDDLAAPHSQRERLLRGESTYTTSSGINEHFIEDQPQLLQYGLTHLLPKASSTEERERLLRRLEMCAKAREESTKIMSIRFAQRDAVKHDMKQDRRVYLDRLLASQRERDERWARRSGVPLGHGFRGKALDQQMGIRNDDILAKLRSLFAKKCGPVRGTALLPGSVCFCLQDVRKGKDQGAPETQSMQPVVLLPTESGYHGSHRYCVVGGLPPLPKKVYRVRWSSLTPLDSGDEDIIFRHYRILWRRPGTKEDELVELAAPSERGLCQILAVDGVHEVNPEELSWNQNEKQLKALRDVEKSNARTLQILQARQEKQLELKRMKQMRMEGSSDTPRRTA